MITGVHTMFYTSEPEALREFFRNKLGFTATDVGDGWLIFDLPDAELGCHPTEEEDGQVPSGTPYLSFYCDDIHQTVEELRAKGVEFSGEVEDFGYGRGISFKVPGGFSIQLYQPAYQRAHHGKNKPG